MHCSSWRGAGSSASNLETPRLTLIAVTPQMLRTEQDGGDFSAVTGLRIPSSWPPEHWEPHVYDWLLNRMAAHPDTEGWCRHIALRSTEGPVLIGNCGCVGPPEVTDDIEIGYSILPEYHRQGHTTEAVHALVDWIFCYENVRSVNAQTFPHLAGSLGVLRNCGFTAAGSGKEPGTVLYRRMRA